MEMKDVGVVVFVKLKIFNIDKRVRICKKIIICFLLKVKLINFICYNLLL